MRIAVRVLLMGLALFMAGVVTVLMGIGLTGVPAKVDQAMSFLLWGWLLGLTGAIVAALGTITPTRSHHVAASKHDQTAT